METAMTDKQTGGPAFPCETLGVDEHGEYRKPYEGMTLRDYFAAKAIAAFIFAGSDYERAAWEAYKQADAMLKARDGQP
jgi:hypothetical protein